MSPSLTDALCTRCALCCDGSLFADVELTGGREASSLEAMGLEVEDGEAGGGLLVLPCGALRGKRCGIYAHRPRCCRTFECGLLQAARRGSVTVDQASGYIAEALRNAARVRKLVAELGQRDTRLSLKERCAEALSLADESATSPALKRKRAELEAAMASLEELIRKRFLGPPAPR